MTFVPLANCLVIAETSNPNEWTLERELAYEANHDLFKIPAGFCTDLASVPRLFWSILPPWGRYAKAAVLHDWLYVVQPPIQRGFGYRTISRKEADGIFLQAMRKAGVDFVTRWTMYHAVRLGGGDL